MNSTGDILRDKQGQICLRLQEKAFENQIFAGAPPDPLAVKYSFLKYHDISIRS